MKIAFDGQLLLDGNKTGIAWNAHHLILELAKYPENECVIQCFSYRIHAEQRNRLDVYRSMGCKIECCSWFQHTWYKLLWLIIPIPYQIFFRSDADITQFFNFTVPPGVKGQRITFIHDMAYKSCPAAVRKKTKIWLELGMKRSCRHTDYIVTVSEFSKKEIVKYLRVPPEKITVVPNAVDHAVYRHDYTERQIQIVLNRYGVEQEYFLYLGTIEPRKNLERLLAAYEKLNREIKHVPQLVLAGGNGWMCNGIYKKARSMKLENRILFTGYIDPADSPVLMCGALAFVFPSLYEGFGMPPLEAMSCKTPVIVSNTAALPEVVGNAAMLVDPECIEDIYAAMKKLVEDPEYRIKLGELGLQRARNYTWKNSAERLMKLYRKVEDIHECI
ncbi:MAG: glycosyltransferase family 4 protein [Eubacterium sp.]|nr:glycosyltransferase family 4 protein [Eubacterium sp.]